MTGSVVVFATIDYGPVTPGPGIGLGILIGHIQDSITHQPELTGRPTVNMFTGIAFVEALALIGLVACFLLR